MCYLKNSTAGRSPLTGAVSGGVGKMPPLPPLNKPGECDQGLRVNGGGQPCLWWSQVRWAGYIAGSGAVAVLLPCCCPACGPCLWLPSVRPTSGSPLIRRALSFWTRAGTRAPGRAARLSCGTRPCACSFGVLIACVRVTGILPDPPLFPQACSIGCDKCATDAGGTVPLTGDKPHADKIGFRTRYVVASDSDDALTRHAPAHAMNHLTTCPMVRPCGAPYDPPFVPPHDPPLRRTLRLAPYDSPHDSPYGPPLDPPPRQVLQLHPELDAAEERLDHEHRRRRGYDCVLIWA